MSEKKINIPVLLSDRTIELIIYGEGSGSLLIEKEDATENGEATVQIREGCFYEYEITRGYSLTASDIVTISKINGSAGRIIPNVYVGTLNIEILDLNNKKCGEIQLEVQSSKITYREDYRQMLEDITEKCTDLLLQHSSYVSQHFQVDFSVESKSLYQRFAFIKSILDSIEFQDSVHKIVSSPTTRWKGNEVIKDIRSVKRFSSSAIRQMSGSSIRTNLPNNHPLKALMQSIPSKIISHHKTESVDTPENRFVKHALVSFQSFCSDFKGKLPKNSRVNQEAGLLVDKLEQFLGHSIFKEISQLTTLPLNSPALQRKAGYREILRIWLMFDLAAKLVWYGGDDVYRGNKRDVAILYEYWVFFELLEIVKDVFGIDALRLENLMEQTKDGLGLKLKQGVFLPVEGIYNASTRKLRVAFAYNKTFNGGHQYPLGGSWTRSLRPDYTLSVWPFGIEQDQAEREELIVHIHFDAKYRIDDLQSIFMEDENLDAEKDDQRRGSYKRADLLKMHTYKDAIRRTGGAYVIYPGNGEKFVRTGFHELIPGLGAFALRPNKFEDGSGHLKKFLRDVVSHLMNRASQREKISLKAYETYKDNNSVELDEALPETYGANRGLIPDETFVLVGYYKKENWDWIINTGLYNARIDSDRGSLRLGPGEVRAKYLLLHSEHEMITGRILEIIEDGPQIYSKQTLVDKGYPSKPSQNHYLVYKVRELHDPEFENKRWDIRKLEGYKKGRASALPFAVSMTQLMIAKSIE